MKCVDTSAHDPLSIIANSDALAGFLELEVLQELNSVCILAVISETSFPLPSQPFWERSSR